MEVIMVTINKIFKLEFYKKLSPFYGSSEGIRYRIAKEPLQKGKTKEEEAALNPKLMATCWPEPYNYETTPDDQKISEYFPFSEEGMQMAVDWINEMHDKIVGEK